MTTPRDRTRSIHLWAPEIREGSGGIQAFSRECVLALQSALPDHPLRVFVKNDLPPPDDPIRRTRAQFHSVANLPARLQNPSFALLGAAHALTDPPALAFTTHLHFLPVLNAIRTLRGGRTAVVLHGIEAWDMKTPSLLTAIRTADAVLSVSQFTQNHVVHAAPDHQELFRLLPNTFNPARFGVAPKPVELLKRYGVRPSQSVLLTISRLASTEGYKGHAEVLAALPKVMEQFPEVHYLIGGTGELQKILAEKAKQLGLEKHVTFTGFIPNEELAAHYQLSDAFVMPSRKEGFGIVFLEAMACGKPVIAGNLDGSVDALDHGRLGILVDPTNPEAIGEAILSVLQKTHSNRLIFEPQALREAVIDQFGPEAFRDRVKDIFSPLLKD